MWCLSEIFADNGDKAKLVTALISVVAAVLMIFGVSVKIIKTSFYKKMSFYTDPKYRVCIQANCLLNLGNSRIRGQTAFYLNVRSAK